jgi:hypothetical protein
MMDFTDEESPALREAVALLRMVPLPLDAAARLRELEKRGRPSERERFAVLWEEYFASRSGATRA